MTTPRRTAIPALVAQALALLGAICFAALHLLMSDVVDPLRQPLSSYALSEPGTTLFAGGALALAATCAITATRRPAVRGWPMARVMLAVSAACFVLVVVFRTDTGDGVSSVDGQIHRYAAGAAFVLLTLVGLVVSRGMARSDRADPAAVRAVRWATTAAAVTLLITTVNTFLPELADGGQWRGLPQRVLLTVQTGLLVGLAGLRPRRTSVAVSLPGTSRKTAPRSEAAGRVVSLASRS